MSIGSKTLGKWSNLRSKLPKGWTVCQLKDVVLKSRKITYGIVQPGDYDPNGVYLVRGQDYSFGWAKPENLFRVAKKVDEPYKRSKLKPNDILMTIVGAGTGNVAIVPKWLDGANITQTTARIAVDPAEGDFRYFYHYLGSLFGRREVYKYQKGGAQPGLNLCDIEKFHVILPPLPERNRISEILSAWDSASGQVEKLVISKQRIKVALMQQLLTGKRRFKEFEKQPWIDHHLGELFAERREASHQALPLLAITSDRGVIPREQVDRKDSSSNDKSKYKRIAPGDIGYNTMRMWQGVSALSGLEGIVSPAYTICVPKEKIDGLFAAYLFKFPPVVHLFFRYSQGLVDDTLSLKFPNFTQVRVTIPSLEEQKRIAAALAQIDKEIDLLQQEVGFLKEQKRGLMQKLLTGQIRVKV